MHTETPDVLVVGAGPVGLFTAIQFASEGLDVMIIDRDEQTAAHSYACVLHQATLALFDKFGVLEPLLDHGRRIDTFAFYEGPDRRAEIRLRDVRADFPFVLAVPQNEVEDALENRLRELGGTVHWSHQLKDFRRMPNAIEADVDKLGGSAFGYSVPHWEPVVEKQLSIQSLFLIAADGPNSFVRRNMDIEINEVGETPFFIVYEFETNQSYKEARIAMTPYHTDALWPFSDDRARWTFQLFPGTATAEFPNKERDHYVFAESKREELVRHHIVEILEDHAPWFSASIDRILWHSSVQFPERIAKSLGHGRCWLAGDAAHQTLPFGAQTMNAGLQESVLLVDGICNHLNKGAPLMLRDAYAAQVQRAWAQLLNPESLKPQKGTSAWTRDHATRILPCLPALGRDLQSAARQLQLRFDIMHEHEPQLAAAIAG